MAPDRTNTDPDTPVSISIVLAVADAEGVSPTELPALYEVVDPDALDKLFTPHQEDRQMEGYVTFRYTGYEVTVSADGQVSIDAVSE